MDHTSNYFPTWLDRFKHPLIILLVSAIVLIPLWSTDIPPLLDYHNHLARQYIIANIDSSQYLNQFYKIIWKASPYLSMDALIQGLAVFMPIDIAGKVYLSLMMLLLAVAPIALNLALFSKVTPISLLGLLFIHNQTVTLGFVNFLFGTGFAICLLALWIRLRHIEVWIRLFIFPLLCSLLFFSHLIGFVIYVLTVSSYELGRHLEQVIRPKARAFWTLDKSQRWNLLSLFLQCSIPLAIFAAYGPSTESRMAENIHGGVANKFILLFDIFDYLIPPYFWSVDSRLAITLPLVGMLLIALRRLAIPSAMLWPIAAMLLLFFSMPIVFFGVWGADQRLLPAIGLLLIGSLRPDATGISRVWSLAVVGIVALVVLRVIAVSIEWRKSNQEYAEYLQAFDSISDNSKMFFAFGHAGGVKNKNWSQPVYHLPCLVLSKRHVFVPNLFASNSGLFTLQYQPNVEFLNRLSPQPLLKYGDSPNWPAIVERFDYFFLVNEHNFSSPVPKELTRVFRGKTVSVYRQMNDMRPESPNVY